MYNIIEEWRCIPDYPNYQVSNLGNVRNIKTGRILSSGINNSGYINVSLCKNGEAKNYMVHRLVASAFIPNPKNLPEINHKDHNRQNNCVDNLEWCTRQYNIEYSNSKQVAQYDLKGNLINIWKSTREIQRQLGFDNSAISKCCLGKFKTMYGYIWKYL